MNRQSLLKTANRYCIAFLLLILIGGNSSMAQYALIILADPIDVRTLSGHVQTKTDFDVRENAHVDLYDLQTGKILASTNTDAKGNFHFKNFGKSEYKVRITLLGFDPLEATLRIRKNAPKLAVLTLEIAT